MATHSSTLAWKIPWMEEPGGLQSMGPLQVGHNWATFLSLFTLLLSRGSISFSLSAIRVVSFASPAFPVAQMVKNLPAMQETWVQSLRREDPLEKGMVIHSSILAWRIPWTEESGRLLSMESQKVEHNWVTLTFTFICISELVDIPCNLDSRLWFIQPGISHYVLCIEVK